MRSLCLVFFFALMGLPWAALAQSEGASPVEREVYAWASVGADGHVSAVECDSKTPAPIADIVKKAILALEFEPATQGGEAVTSRTAVSARLRFTPDGSGGYATEVVDVLQPSMRTHEWLQPRYPADAARDGVGGLVWVEFETRPDGTVDPQTLQVAESRFHRDRKPYKGPLAIQLMDAAREVAAQWRFFTHEVAGVPIATRQRVSLKFTPPGYGPGQRADYDYGDFGRNDDEAVPTPIDGEQRLAVLLRSSDATGHN